jgi:hypothetical protein
MRNERSHPWGLDETDPRLDLRRAAAEAQRDIAAVEPPEADDLTPDDIGRTDAATERHDKALRPLPPRRTA